MDLFYRLKVITIELPPLAGRGQDIPLLAEYFLKKMSENTGRRVKQLDKSAMAALKHHAWPGNVRELQNAMEHAFVMSSNERICLSDLPENIVFPKNADITVTEADHSASEKEGLLAALESNDWNVSLTARKLGIARVTLYRRMKRQKIFVKKHLSHP
jgi:DNA-binding NtrC family response regulator